MLLSNVRPPASSTLFPYTTLFRSLGDELHPGVVQLLGDAAQVGVAQRLSPHVDPQDPRVIPARRREVRLDGLRQLLLRDRKSTRLNSSHSQISYAVFCLKKKTPPS